MKLVCVNVDYIQVFVMIDKVGIMINANVSVKNELIKVDVMMDLFGILVRMDVYMINRVILVSIWIMWIVNVKINKLVEKCDKDNDGNGKIYNATLYDYRRVCKSCTLYVVLLIMAFIINMGKYVFILLVREGKIF